MEFSRQRDKVVEAAVESQDQEPIQLNELQLLAVSGGSADVTLY